MQPVRVETHAGMEGQPRLGPGRDGERPAEARRSIGRGAQDGPACGLGYAGLVGPAGHIEAEARRRILPGQEQADRPRFGRRILEPEVEHA